MSYAMAAMRVRARQVQTQTKVKRLGKQQGEDEIVLTLSKNIKDFVSVIRETLQKIGKKRESVSKGSQDESNEVCKEEVKIMEDNPTGSITDTSSTKDMAAPKRKVSEPIPIPTRDRNGERYPEYDRKKFLYI